MNLNDPNVWMALAAVVTLLLMVGGVLIRLQSALMVELRSLQLSLMGEIKETARSSDAGRARLYERIEAMGHEIRTNFVPRDVYNANMEAIKNAQDELKRRDEEIVRRIEAQCLFVRSRRGEE
ncbi:MAG: hypothetical protein WCF85_19735 [Rhodospirillaceae bacterium]